MRIGEISKCFLENYYNNNFNLCIKEENYFVWNNKKIKKRV